MRLGLLFTLILYAGEPTHACKIEFTPQRVFVKFGSPISANCSAPSCNNFQGIGWESTLGGTGLLEGLSFVDLKASIVNEWSFEPQCFIMLSSGEQIINTLPVTVYKMPDKVHMPKPKSPMTASSKYILQCEVADVAPAKALVISWYKDNEIIFEKTFLEDQRLFPVNESHQTTFKVVAGDNGKKVWCEAKLNLMPAEQNPQAMRSEPHKLTVLYPPTITGSENETLEISTGKEVILNCTATGNPTPNYKWLLAGNLLKGNQEPVFNLTFREPGVYRCTAYNDVGEVTKTFHLNKPPDNFTTMATILGVCLSLGVVGFIAGVVYMTKTGGCALGTGSII